MARRKRSRYLGKWTEPKADPIILPFSVENLAYVLRCGLTPDHPYTHQQIADWARRHSEALMDADDKADMGIGPAPDFTGVDVLEDVGVQWDLFLANTYRFEELQSLDLSSVELPEEWFREWLRRLEGT
jgi:hypothetical protein